MGFHYTNCILFILILGLLLGLASDIYAADTIFNTSGQCQKKINIWVIGFALIAAIYDDLKLISPKVAPILSELKEKSAPEIIGILYLRKENGEDVPSLWDLKHYSFMKVFLRVFLAVFVTSLALSLLSGLFFGTTLNWLLNTAIITTITIHYGSKRFHTYGAFLYLTPDKGNWYFSVAIIFCTLGLLTMTTTETIALACSQPLYHEILVSGFLNGTGALLFSFGYFGILKIKDEHAE